MTQKILVIATFNPHKLKEIEDILPELPFSLKPLCSFPGALPAVEDGTTLEENAVKKALSAARYTGLPSLADDTGLEVDALGGAPGVLSARYSGAGASYAENNARLLAELSGVPLPRRSARFACVTALATASGRVRTARGVLEGRIAEFPRGDNGFGYDPLFEAGGGPRTLAELSAEEKNAISHRVLALKNLLPELLELSRGA